MLVCVCKKHAYRYMGESVGDVLRWLEGACVVRMAAGMQVVCPCVISHFVPVPAPLQSR